MAMNLLTAVQTNPNVTPEFRTQAVGVANFAIALAQSEIANQGISSTTLPAFSTSTPVYAPVTAQNAPETTITTTGGVNIEMPVIVKQTPDFGFVKEGNFYKFFVIDEDGVRRPFEGNLYSELRIDGSPKMRTLNRGVKGDFTVEMPAGAQYGKGEWEMEFGGNGITKIDKFIVQ